MTFVEWAAFASYKKLSQILIPFVFHVGIFYLLLFDITSFRRLFCY